MNLPRLLTYGFGQYARFRSENGDLFRLRPWRRHSLVLVVTGFVYVAFGLVYMVFPLDEAGRSSLRAHIAATAWVGGIHAWAVMFIIVGLLAVLSARWPPASETWGYTALTSLAVLWGLFYMWGVLFGAPIRSIAGCLIWLLVSFLWWSIAGLRNPQDLPPAGD